MSATITDTITDDLRTILRDGRPFPTALSLPSLARHYDVSITPVRRAVGVLLNEGLLRKSPSGRLEPSSQLPIRQDAAPSHPQEESAPSSLSERLTEEILWRSLRNDTEYLREEAVAQQMGVGRTVLRQAFNRLAGQGLLEHIPRCGWRVRIFDESDMVSYLEARESLERTALTLARPHLQTADLEVMLAGNSPDAPEDSPSLNNDIHAYLIEKSGNSYIQDFFARHGRYWAALFDFAAPETHVLREVATQHRAILTALLQQDWAAAEQALSHHIHAQRSIVGRLMTNRESSSGQ